MHSKRRVDIGINILYTLKQKYRRCDEIIPTDSIQNNLLFEDLNTSIDLLNSILTSLHQR